MPNITGDKWGANALGTTGGVLTWSIAPGGLSGVRATFQNFQVGLSDTTSDPTGANFDIEEVIRQAFAMWSAAADIDFVQVVDGGQRFGAPLKPDIRIGFGIIDGALDVNGGGIQGVANFPQSGGPEGPEAGDILFDIEDIRSRPDEAIEFRTIATHEIGHAIGLDHVAANDDAIMRPVADDDITELRPDDISGVRTIYGAQNGDQGRVSLADLGAELTLAGDQDGLVVLGTRAAETVTGGDGDEMLRGAGGRDQLSGGDGADTLAGGGGADRVIGGDGDDRLLGGGGRDRLIAGDGDDTLRGGAMDDRARGGRGDDKVTGQAGADRLAGNIGADTIKGGGGADRVIGGGGDDLMSGDAGADRMIGGRGDDTMTGGGGGDRFVFNDNAGVDLLRDFTPDVDLIDYTGHSGVSGIDDLNVLLTDDGLVLDDQAGGRVLLAGVFNGVLDTDDFVFAA